MSEEMWSQAETLQYTLTEAESALWNAYEGRQREEFLRELGERLFREAIEQGFNMVNVYDRDGNAVMRIEGKRFTLEEFLQQNRLN